MDIFLQTTAILDFFRERLGVILTIDIIYAIFLIFRFGPSAKSLQVSRMVSDDDADT